MKKEELIEIIKVLRRKGNKGDYCHNSSTHNNEILEKKGFKNGDIVEIDTDYKVQFFASKGKITCNLFYRGRFINNCSRYGIE